MKKPNNKPLLSASSYTSTDQQKAFLRIPQVFPLISPSISPYKNIANLSPLFFLTSIRDYGFFLCFLPYLFCLTHSLESEHEPKTTPTTSSSLNFVSIDSKTKSALLIGSLQYRVESIGSSQAFSQKQSDVFKVHSQLNEVAINNLSNSALVLKSKSKVIPSEEKDEPAEKHGHQNRIPDAASISAFMSQVADIVELVDSRDIMELQLKQLDCEVSIRKKEALQPPPVASPGFMMQPHPQSVFPSQLPQTPLSAPASTVPVPSPSPPKQGSPSPTKPKSSHPPLKCPMAGTFYRSPAPGAPPFVKVGDKIQKGQVVCIIEAMKLMNEIEADQSGTLVEILAEDGKPVSVDTPLFVIEP